jgi:hypothetical protein
VLQKNEIAKTLSWRAFVTRADSMLVCNEQNTSSLSRRVAPRYGFTTIVSYGLKDLGVNVLSLASIQRKYQRKITAARNLLKIIVVR